MLCVSKSYSELECSSSKCFSKDSGYSSMLDGSLFNAAALQLFMVVDVICTRSVSKLLEVMSVRNTAIRLRSTVGCTDVPQRDVHDHDEPIRFLGRDSGATGPGSAAARHISSN